MNLWFVLSRPCIGVGPRLCKALCSGPARVRAWHLSLTRQAAREDLACAQAGADARARGAGGQRDRGRRALPAVLPADLPGGLARPARHRAPGTSRSRRRCRRRALSTPSCACPCAALSRCARARHAQPVWTLSRSCRSWRGSAAERRAGRPERGARAARARWRDCYSDEHYFATLLAAEGRDAETDCRGYAVHVDWSRMGEHPRAYEPREVTSSRRALSPATHRGWLVRVRVRARYAPEIMRSRCERTLHSARSSPRAWPQGSEPWLRSARMRASTAGDRAAVPGHLGQVPGRPLQRVCRGGPAEHAGAPPPRRLRQLRGPTEGCRYPAAIASAAAQLVPVDAVGPQARAPPAAAAAGPPSPNGGIGLWQRSKACRPGCGGRCQSATGRRVNAHPRTCPTCLFCTPSALRQ